MQKGFIESHVFILALLLAISAIIIGLVKQAFFFGRHVFRYYPFID